MAARPLRRVALILLPLVLSACVSVGGGGKAPPSLLTLTPAQSAPAGTASTSTAALALMVMEPETDQSLSVLRVPVQVDDANVAYLKDALWVEKPSRLFRALLAETLRARTGRLVLEDSQAVVPAAGSTLSGRLIAMGYDARTGSVVVRYDAIRNGPGGAVLTKRFESVVPGVAPTAAAVAPALNRAANDVAGQVADWVGR
ncbi:MAG: membrane integrity-associated transporter subunit PqiC [Sphingomonadales bacterium]|nr:membrane integrity-associated transporter subunit PqiC [Sphingomonadales bacterium]